GKFVADTYPANKIFMFWKPERAVNDPFPKQEQWHWPLLVFLTNKGPTHFNGLAHHFMQFGFKPKKVLQVKSIDPILLIDLVPHTTTICARNLICVIITQEHMIVVIIKFIKIC